jgi:hypothetical protein
MPSSPLSLRIFAAALSLIACSSSPEQLGGDASADSPVSDAPNVQDGTSNDVVSPSDSSSDATTDAGQTEDAGPLAPNPPAGSTLCGSGTFGQSEAVAACQASALGGFGTTLDCGAVMMTTGTWQAWCTTTEVYMWAEFEGLSTSTATCPTYFLDPQYAYGETGGDTGNAGGNGYVGYPSGEITGLMPTSAAIWVTLPSATIPGTGSLYVGGGIDPTCKVDAHTQLLLLGVTLTWK